MRDARDPCDPDKNTQTQSPVELPEDLDPHDPSAVRHPTMDLRHEVVHGLAMLFRLETLGSDIGKPNTTAAVHPFQKVNFSTT